MRENEMESVKCPIKPKKGRKLLKNENKLENSSETGNGKLAR